VYRWELDGPADQEFADLNPAVQAVLTAFLDAVWANDRTPVICGFGDVAGVLFPC
jgi:hypothetical protein